MAKKDWMIIESELDEDQIKVLMATNKKSCIVSGCAGSGKSILALIKAQRIQKEEGNNYQIIVFTKALCNYMNAGREILGLKNDFYYHEEWRWRKSLKTYANGISYMVYERDEKGNKIPNRPRTDFVIVDEIQDFSREEIQEFIDATNKNFFFFGDTAQSIYQELKDTMPVHGINRLFPYDKEPKNFSLYRNYRLPLPVARVAQYVGIDLEAFDEKTYKSKEAKLPKFIKYSSFNEQIKAIANILKNKKGTLSDVGILLPHNDNVKEISFLLNSFEIDHEAKFEDNDNWRNSVNNLNFKTSNPKVMTYHSAKGLQFETVFLPGISFLSEYQKISEQKALYVAMTRTYRDLYVMYTGSLPAPLSEVPSNLYTTLETEKVEDI